MSIQFYYQDLKKKCFDINASRIFLDNLNGFGIYRMYNQFKKIVFTKTQTNSKTEKLKLVPLNCLRCKQKVIN